MPTTPEAIAADIAEAATAGFRGRLIARGQARAIIWRDGALPADAPAFAPQLSYDLHSYGYALLGLGLRLRELGGDPARARTAFEQAATALEAVMAKGNRLEVDRDFHFIMAAASYHLAHLLVFDEGHMIGLNEREVRYEVQIQRLLRRADAQQRRIVCLSAILPDGDQLEDFAGWLRRDHPGGLIKLDWRPTRLRFGEVVWASPSARLNLRVGDERPWVQRFLTGAAPPDWIPPKRRRTRLFPDDQRELCLATAWRLVDDGQTVLIFCPERRSVEPFADALDDILQSSLWHRRLLRQNEQVQQALKAGLVSRSRRIWNQSTTARRRGYFLAGVGLTTGHALDAIAPETNLLLIQANDSIIANDVEAAIAAITGIAERVFAFYPFTPDSMPDNWRDILRAWLLGQPLAAMAADQASETLQFVEGGLVYRLPWAMEAIRVRAAANGDTVGVFDLPLEDHELGVAVPAVETGTLNRSAAILIQAGFNSRLAAIKAVTDTGATFTTGQELRQWLSSDAVAAWSAQPDWPTAETRAMWTEFAQSFTPRDSRTWADRRYWTNVTWLGVPPPPGTPVQVHDWGGQARVLAADGGPLGTVQAALNPNRSGLLRAQVATDVAKIGITYLGPDDLIGA